MPHVPSFAAAASKLATASSCVNGCSSQSVISVLSSSWLVSRLMLLTVDSCTIRINSSDSNNSIKVNVRSRSDERQVLQERQPDRALQQCCDVSGV